MTAAILEGLDVQDSSTLCIAVDHKEIAKIICRGLQSQHWPSGHGVSRNDEKRGETHVVFKVGRELRLNA